MSCESCKRCGADVTNGGVVRVCPSCWTTIMHVMATVCDVQLELDQQYAGHGELLDGLKRIWAAMNEASIGGVIVEPVHPSGKRV